MFTFSNKYACIYVEKKIFLEKSGLNQINQLFCLKKSFLPTLIKWQNWFKSRLA